MNRIALTCVAVLLVGCVAPNYTGPGTQSEFLAARYQCIKEIQNTSVAAGGFNEYGGGFSATSAPSCGAIASCMALKGYNQDPKGNLSIPVEQQVRCIR